MYLTHMSECRLLMQVKFGAPTRLEKLRNSMHRKRPEICPAYMCKNGMISLAKVS